MQKIKAVLFDLDGTLLPMDQDEFTGYYFGRLCAKAAPLGYEAKKLIDTIWKGTAAMMKNDGSVTNEQAFWDLFASVYGREKLADKPLFNDFYANEFEDAKVSCGFNPDAVGAVRELKALGYRVTLATNPIFPDVAQQKRIRWAGFQPEDFEFYASYEIARHAKPNPQFFLDVTEQLGLQPNECLMVGNDAGEDYACLKVGMPLFLITDCLINKDAKDISDIPRGGFPQLMEYVRGLA